jgi:glutaredoxin
MAEVTVRIFTTPTCPKCPEAKALVKEIRRHYEFDVDEIDLSRDLLTGLQYQVASAPSIAVNGCVIARGEVPRKEELIREIKRAMG